MLDDLLGRTALKERIESLEEDKRHLQRQLEAEQDRAADAKTARQEAEREVNRLEDRVTELQDKVSRLESDEAARTPRRRETLRGDRLAAVLDRLTALASDPEGILTAYVADDHDLPAEVREAFGDRAGLVGGGAPCLAVADDAGLVSACLSVPVAPAPFATWSDAVELDRSWFEPSGEYTLALVRSDLFAMGTYEGKNRTAFHGFDSDLKSQHSKGGFSQSRFERLRDEQIANHVERCQAALAERDADPLYVVGERSVLGDVSDLADVTQPVSATGEPEAALGDAFREFWTVQLVAV
ncbi:Vms1/Ankzf1 family peptidyl-tRNA hydrolase [Halobacteriales archaeon Cl-PHB]